MAIAVDALDHIVLTVADIGRTVEFYTDVLGMTPEMFRATDGNDRHALKFGRQKINLHLAGAEFEPNAREARTGSADLCFLTGARIANWQTHLAALGIAVELGPVARTGATGPLVSLYLRDPDGNLIEVSVRG